MTIASPESVSETILHSFEHPHALALWADDVEVEDTLLVCDGAPDSVEGCYQQLADTPLEEKVRFSLFREFGSKRFSEHHLGRVSGLVQRVVSLMRERLQGIPLKRI